MNVLGQLRRDLTNVGGRDETFSAGLQELAFAKQLQPEFGTTWHYHFSLQPFSFGNNFNQIGHRVRFPISGKFDSWVLSIISIRTWASTMTPFTFQPRSFWCERFSTPSHQREQHQPLVGNTPPVRNGQWRECGLSFFDWLLLGHWFWFFSVSFGSKAQRFLRRSLWTVWCSDWVVE